MSEVGTPTARFAPPQQENPGSTVVFENVPRENQSGTVSNRQMPM